MQRMPQYVNWLTIAHPSSAYIPVPGILGRPKLQEFASRSGYFQNHDRI
jgi:hypothetical protein